MFYTDFNFSEDDMLCVQARYAKVTDKASIQKQNLNNYIHDIIAKTLIQNMLNMYRKKKIKGIFSAVRNQQHLHNSD
jgi:hypothetical protein